MCVVGPNAYQRPPHMPDAVPKQVAVHIPRLSSLEGPARTHTDCL